VRYPGSVNPSQLLANRTEDATRNLGHLALAILLLAAPCLCQETIPQEIRPQEIIQPHGHARAGEICIVCNNRVSTQDDCYLVDGQRIVVHAAVCNGQFLSHPGQYMAPLRPNDILFGVFHSRVPSGWFWAGIYVLLGLVFGGLSAHRAIATGRAPLRWFLAGLLFSVVAYLYLLAARPEAAVALPPGLHKLPLTRDPLPCPNCGHGNHPSALRCSRCGRNLEPTASSEVSAALGA
jgi:hypothetical protein